MQPTKVTWQQTGEVMREQESAESAKCLCVYLDVSQLYHLFYGIHLRGLSLRSGANVTTIKI